MISGNHLNYSGSTPAGRENSFQPSYVAAFSMDVNRNITDTSLKKYTCTPFHDSYLSFKIFNMDKACYNGFGKYSFQAKIVNEIFTVVASRCRLNLKFVLSLLLFCLFALLFRFVAL